MTKRSRPSPSQQSGDQVVRSLLHQLLERSDDPSRFLELYYWTAEPGLAEFIRKLLAIPTSARDTLMAFISMADGATDSVKVSVGPKGDVTLSSPNVSDA